MKHYFLMLLIDESAPCSIRFLKMNYMRRLPSKVVKLVTNLKQEGNFHHPKVLVMRFNCNLRWFWHCSVVVREVWSLFSVQRTGKFHYNEVTYNERPLTTKQCWLNSRLSSSTNQYITKFAYNEVFAWSQALRYNGIRLY